MCPASVCLVVSLINLIPLQNTLDAYPCGSDHTPSPMASRTAVEAETILHSPSARLTAVALSVRDRHTIAFLGDSKGNLHKVPGQHGSVPVRYLIRFCLILFLSCK